MDAQRGVAGGDGLCEGECGLLLFGVEADLCRFAAVRGGIVNALKFDFNCVQRDGAGGLLDGVISMVSEPENVAALRSGANSSA